MAVRATRAARWSLVIRQGLSGGSGPSRDGKQTDSSGVVEFSGSDGGESEGASAERPTQPDDIGAELARLRKERAAADAEVKAEEGLGGLWGGVLEETKMIQWPAFSSVLGTTGVVLTVIVLSSVVLLTVNAILAQISDAVFELPAVRELWHLSK